MQITCAGQPSLSPLYICVQNAREGLAKLFLYAVLWSPPTLEASGRLSAPTSAYRPPCQFALIVMYLLLRLLRSGPPAVLFCTV